MKTTRTLKAGALLLAGFFIFWLGFQVGNGHIQVAGLTSSNQPHGLDPSPLWRIWNQVDQNYDGNVNNQNEIYGAMKGLVASLGDPYSEFMDPTETKNFQSELSGTVEGIGAEVGISSGKIVIISPLTDSPAERAGLKPGDIITSIDGKSTTSLSLGDAVGKIRGKKGTVVDLAITRGSATLNFKITRDVVQTPSVISRMEQGYAYLQITRFSSETGNVFHDQLAALLKQSPKGIVVDVRNNPGGYLQTAVQIASEFLPANKVVVTERTKNKNVETLRASEGGLAIDTSLPMTVLVNGGSASASEILAGALKDNHRATLIGTKTFGKGSVQDFETLPDDSSLRLTIAHWYMPSGKGINGVGMKPDVTVTDAAAGDPVLDRAIQFLGSK